MLVGIIFTVALMVIAYFFLTHSTAYKNAYGNEMALKLIKRSYKLGVITKEEYFEIMDDLEE